MSLTSLKRKTWDALSKYHPYRYGAYRDWASSLIPAYKKIAGGRFVSSAEVNDDEWERLKELLNPKMTIAVKESRGDNPASYLLKAKAYLSKFTRSAAGDENVDRSLAEEAAMYSHWATHTTNQRAVFEFTQELTEMFLWSQTGDVILDDVILPCPSVYLHFGKQVCLPLKGFKANIFRASNEFINRIETSEGNDIPLARKLKAMGNYRSKPAEHFNAYFLEGAYVTQSEKGISILLIAQPNAGDYPRQESIRSFLDVNDDHLEFMIPALRPGISIKEAIVSDRDEILQQNLELIKDMAWNADEERLKALHDRARQTEYEARESFLATMNLVFNAILYITNYPDEVEEDLPPLGAGQNEIHQMISKAQVDGKSGRYMQRQLEALLPFRKVKFCGRAESRKAEELRARQTGTEIKRTFMGRIGHWRKLTEESGFKSTRKIWIKPVADPTGAKIMTIYEVF